MTSTDTVTIKEAVYPNIVAPGTTAFVYALLPGRRCVFSGTNTNGVGTTTLHASETIIQIICTSEGIRWQEWTFFDLQTQQMYRGADAEGNVFEFDQLVVSPSASGRKSAPGEQPRQEFRVWQWQRVACPQDVLTLFAPYLGENPVQRPKPE